MADEFDLLETNSNQKSEKVDVNWGKAIDTMKSKLSQEDDPERRQKILNATLDDVVGIYLAGFVLKSSEVIEEQTENLEEVVNSTLNKGKEIFNDITSNETEVEAEPEAKEEPIVEKKSARERLKDKGLM